MATIRAIGRLRHMFHGTYRAGITLTCATAADAAALLTTLASVAGWRAISREESGAPGADRTLVWIGDSAGLAAVKAQFAGHLTVPPCGWRHCKRKCADAEIDSIAHSIDYGPAFRLEIPRAAHVVPAEQGALPFGG